MRPFIHRFKETPAKKATALSKLTYSESQQLTVFSNTNLPAVGSLALDTETMTKAGHETSDSDDDMMAYLDTSLETRAAKEHSDNDDN